MNLKKILENPIPWPDGLRTDTDYSRLHDDHDGEFTGRLHVGFISNSDAIVSIEYERAGKVEVSEMLRFRNWAGGGRSLRTYNALVMLAEAIRLDQIENPDQQ